MALFLVRKWSPRRLIVFGVVFVGISALIARWPWLYDRTLYRALFGRWFDNWKSPMTSVEAHQSGDAALFRWRLWQIVYWDGARALAHTFWETAALMAFGMALAKRGIFGGRALRPVLRRFVAVGYGVGLPLAAYGIFERIAGKAELAALLGIHSLSLEGNWIFIIGSTLVAFGHLGALLLLAQRAPESLPIRMLAAAGKMPLTNYLAQTVLCHFLFESYGFGMWNRWDWSGQLVVCIAIWAIEIGWSLA